MIIVNFPVDANHKEVINWVREYFGDNNPYLPYKQRRWVTGNRCVCFRYKIDAVFFKLRWS